jgi:hypothetical protein
VWASESKWTGDSLGLPTVMAMIVVVSRSNFAVGV